MILDGAIHPLHLPERILAALGEWSDPTDFADALALDIDDETGVPTRGWFPVYGPDGEPLRETDGQHMDRQERPIENGTPFPYMDWLRHEMSLVPDKIAAAEAAEQAEAEARIEAAKADGITLDDIVAATDA